MNSISKWLENIQQLNSFETFSSVKYREPDLSKNAKAVCTHMHRNTHIQCEFGHRPKSSMCVFMYVKVCYNKLIAEWVK